MSRLDYFAAAPAAMKAWTAASMKINASLDQALVRLVEIRTSQLNGCANCINMHTAQAREAGETEQRMHLLAAWRDAPCYTDRERAALAWTEAMTRLYEGGRAHEQAYTALEAEFSKEEQAVLTLVINMINGWNRLSVGFGSWIEPELARRYQQPATA